MSDNDQIPTARLGVFVEEKYGARVATIREGSNAVEMKDNRDGTCDLTVFWTNPRNGINDDLSAFCLNRDDLMAMRRAIDGLLVKSVPESRTPPP